MYTLTQATAKHNTEIGLFGEITISSNIPEAQSQASKVANRLKDLHIPVAAVGTGLLQFLWSADRSTWLAEGWRGLEACDTCETTSVAYIAALPTN